MYLLSCNFTSAIVNMPYISNSQIVVRPSYSQITWSKVFWEAVPRVMVTLIFTGPFEGTTLLNFFVYIQTVR
jgi:hypothetical protein